MVRNPIGLAVLRNAIRLPGVVDSGGVPNTPWINKDLIPLPPSRRTWNDWDFIGFWAVISLSISTWQACAALLETGLNIWQAMIACIVAKFLILLIAISHGYPGATWHIGYTVLSRATFGLWGSYLALFQRIVLCTVWYAVQSFTAAQCFSVFLSAIFPSFYHLRNTLPSSIPMDTKQLISFFLYHAVSVPLLLTPPERLKTPFKVVSAISAITILGTAVGSIVHAGGIDSKILAAMHTRTETIGYVFVKAVNTVINSHAVGLSNQPDFSRFVSKPGQQIWGQAVSIMILGNVVPLLGLLATAAAYKSFDSQLGSNLWNPPVILTCWLNESYSPKSRCATAFAALGFLISTMGLNTIDNGMSGGMDLAGVWPRYINIRKGTILIAIVSIAIQPWYILQSATIFLSVLSSYGLFLGPMIGVFTSDYFCVKKCNIKLSDLYYPRTSDNSGRSIYWYSHGINWRAYFAWVIGFLPGISGAASLNTNLTSKLPRQIVRLFSVSFIIGYFVAFFAHWGISKVFPPSGIGEHDALDVFGTFTEEEARALGVQPLPSAESEPDTVLQTVVADNEFKSLTVF
ncbi:uncharacterized protein SAPINGB_P005232 [Magnusiomyces paraingens]|uniref:Uracil permease n=1 Tax=Magnusiomyces paraingens TaxID=2606893 RepID=A0A5E8C1B0_9ASCO|nr:uncharacterized protein SAPINGB_P005232 [Saprochaete ingens]VVT56720.1 unnamed protein product [Saprochaete ingens]